MKTRPSTEGVNKISTLLTGETIENLTNHLCVTFKNSLGSRAFLKTTWNGRDGELRLLLLLCVAIKLPGGDDER